MSKSGGVFNFPEPRRADDVTQTMSKGGGGGACGISSPPLQEILYPRLLSV